MKTAMVAATAALTLTASLVEPSYALTPKQRRELDNKTEAMYVKVEPRRPEPDRFRGTELRAPAKKTTSPASARAANDNKRRPAAKVAKKKMTTNKVNKKTAKPVNATKEVASKAPSKKKVSRFNASLPVGVLLGVGLWGYTNRNPSEPSVSNLANKTAKKKTPAAAGAAAPAATASSTTMATKKIPAENAKEAQEWINAWMATAPERRAASAQAWIDNWKKSQKKGFFSW